MGLVRLFPLCGSARPTGEAIPSIPTSRFFVRRWLASWPPRPTIEANGEGVKLVKGFRRKRATPVSLNAGDGARRTGPFRPRARLAALAMSTARAADRMSPRNGGNLARYVQRQTASRGETTIRTTARPQVEQMFDRARGRFLGWGRTVLKKNKILATLVFVLVSPGLKQQVIDVETDVSVHFCQLL